MEVECELRQSFLQNEFRIMLLYYRRIVIIEWQWIIEIMNIVVL